MSTRAAGAPVRPGRPHVTGAQPCQAEFEGCDEVDAVVETGQTTADQVDLDRVKVPGRHGGPEPRRLATAPAAAHPGDAGRVEEESGQQVGVEDGGLDPGLPRQHGRGGGLAHPDVAWEGDGWDPGDRWDVAREDFLTRVVRAT